MDRLQRILDKADELGMVAIVGYFYFGQDQRLKDEAAVRRAVLNATNWILDHRYRNVLVEVNNECNIAYDHDILKPPRVTELIQLVQNQTRDGRRLMVSTSFGGTTSCVVAATAGNAMPTEMLCSGIMTAQKIISGLLVISTAASRISRLVGTTPATFPVSTSARSSLMAPPGTGRSSSASP